MKYIFLLLTITLLSMLKLRAQGNVKIFIGGNYSNVTYHRVSHGLDSFGLRKNYMLLPCMGIDLNFNISEKFQFTSGLGINSLGSRNYTDTLSQESYLLPNLKLNYIRIPILFSFNVDNNIKLFSGYSFNYCFRKNYNFLALNSSQTKFVNIFNRIHHGLNLGMGIDVNNFNFTLLYHHGLNKIWDTEQLYPDQRAFLNLHAIQITAGYLIKNNKQL